MVAVVAPLLHKYVLLPVPPVAVMEIDPLTLVAHVASVVVPLITIPAGAATVNDAEAVQPAASVTVTE